MNDIELEEEDVSIHQTFEQRDDDGDDFYQRKRSIEEQDVDKEGPTNHTVYVHESMHDLVED